MAEAGLRAMWSLRTVRLRRTLLAITLPLAPAFVQARPSASPPPDAPLRPQTSAAGPNATSPDAAANDAPFEGRVAAYVLSPDGRVAGLVLENGRQVSVPPHLGEQLVLLVQPGQQVRVGARRDDARGPGSLRTITAVASGLTLSSEPAAHVEPSPLGAPGERGAASGAALEAMQAAGAIRLQLHGPRGETNGLLLDTGTQIFFPPHVANEAGDWLRRGDSIRVEGYGRTSRYGSVVQATRIEGPDGRTVTIYGPPESRQKRR